MCFQLFGNSLGKVQINALGFGITCSAVIDSMCVMFKCCKPLTILSIFFFCLASNLSINRLWSQVYNRAGRVSRATSPLSAGTQLESSWHEGASTSWSASPTRRRKTGECKMVFVSVSTSNTISDHKADLNNFSSVTNILPQCPGALCLCRHCFLIGHSEIFSLLLAIQQHTAVSVSTLMKFVCCSEYPLHTSVYCAIFVTLLQRRHTLIDLHKVTQTPFIHARA